MAYMRIHCDTCGGTWEIYQRDNWNDDRARQCPHCFSEIDSETWEREILPAFGAVADANAELYKHSTGYQEPAFTVDFIADPRPQDDEKFCVTCPFSEIIPELGELINLI